MQFSSLLLGTLVSWIKTLTTLEAKVVSPTIIPELAVLPYVPMAKFECWLALLNARSNLINLMFLKLSLCP
jgi:hypothetical protein